jgi:hypothetical protein
MKTFRLPLVLCIAAVSCLSFSASNAQNIVQNPEFEMGTPPTNIPPWVVTDTSNNTFLGTNSLFANSGNNYMNLGAENTVGTLSQTLATVPGVSYTLSYFLAHDVTSFPSNQFSVSFNGVTVPGSTLTNIGAFGYTQFSFSGLVANSSSTVLTFQFTNNDDFFRLDSVSVVPEPSTYALLITAGGMLGLVQYRRLQRRRAGASA